MCRFCRNLSVRVFCRTGLKRVISVLYNRPIVEMDKLYIQTDLNGLFTATKYCQVYHSILLKL